LEALASVVAKLVYDNAILATHQRTLSSNTVNGRTFASRIVFIVFRYARRKATFFIKTSRTPDRGSFASCIREAVQPAEYDTVIK